MLFFLSSCRKADTPFSNEATVSSNTGKLKEQFFNASNADPEIQKLAADIQRQDSLFNFLPAFVKKNGVPKWDKTLYKVQSNLNKSKAGLRAGTETDNQGIFLIPLQSTTSPDIQSYITAYKHNDSSYTYRLYNRDTMNAKRPTTPEDKNNLLNVQAVFGYFEKSINNKDSIAVAAPGNGRLKNVRIGFGNKTGRSSATERAAGATCSVSLTVIIEYEWRDFSYCYNGCGAWVEVSEILIVDIFCSESDATDGYDGGGYNSGGDYSNWWLYGSGWPWNSPTGYPEFVVNPEDAWYPWWTSGGYDPYSQYALTNDDYRILNEIQQEIYEADQAANSPCHATNRFGSIKQQGNLEHWLIQFDYLSRYPGGALEYIIPNAGANGGWGFADIVNENSKEIFEIKPDNDAGYNAGRAEVANYIAKANQYCSNGVWRAGTNYTGTVLAYPKDPTKVLSSRLYESGLIVYEYLDKTTYPLPVSIPQTITDKIRDLINKLIQNPSNIEQQILVYLRLNPELATYLKNAAIGAGIAIVVGTIIEDILTAGTGIFDDWASFTIAYRLVRIAAIM